MKIKAHCVAMALSTPLSPQGGSTLSFYDQINNLTYTLDNALVLEVVIVSFPVIKKLKQELSAALSPVPLQKYFIGPVDLHECGLSILAGVVVWMPCLGQLPIAAGYILHRSLHFKRQNLQHTNS